MKLTREEALKYHRQMWTDMQKELGDKPQAGKRVLFKERWCDKQFPDEHIYANCFLCECLNTDGLGCNCHCGRDCLIVWPHGSCTAHNYYYDALISEILALPEREVEDGTDT